jgi:toluene monooxygenase electron transfer component
MARITRSPVGDSFVCASDETILSAGLRAGLGLQYECNAGACGACKIKLLTGQVTSLRPDSPALSEADHRRGRILACQSVPLEDCTIAVVDDPARRPPIPPQRLPAMIVAFDLISPDMAEVALLSDGPAAFLPGQFAAWIWPDGLRRMYSMSNLGNTAGEWRFLIRRTAGDAGRRLFGAPALGAKLQLEAPYGAAFLRPPTSGILCVAGGSGLGPMLSVARGFAASHAGPDLRLRFLIGARTFADLGQGQVLTMIREIDPRIQVDAILSQVEPADPAWTGACGNLDLLVGDVLREAHSIVDIYMAGPPAMISSIIPVVEGAGLTPDRLYYDRFF